MDRGRKITEGQRSRKKNEEGEVACEGREKGDEKEHPEDE